jgi:hypothetical protein
VRGDGFKSVPSIRLLSVCRRSELEGFPWCWDGAALVERERRFGLVQEFKGISARKPEKEEK